MNSEYQTPPSRPSYCCHDGFHENRLLNSFTKPLDQAEMCVWNIRSSSYRFWVHKMSMSLHPRWPPWRLSWKSWLNPCQIFLNIVQDNGASWWFKFLWSVTSQFPIWLPWWQSWKKSVNFFSWRIDYTRWVSFYTKFTRQGFENACWHREACREY